MESQLDYMGRDSKQGVYDYLLQGNHNTYSQMLPKHFGVYDYLL